MNTYRPETINELESVFLKLLEKYPDLDSSNNPWISPEAKRLVEIAKDILGYDFFENNN